MLGEVLFATEQETEDRRQETGDGSQESGDAGQSSVCVEQPPGAPDAIAPTGGGAV
jgi:hypothetical protein